MKIPQGMGKWKLTVTVDTNDEDITCNHRNSASYFGDLVYHQELYLKECLVLLSSLERDLLQLTNNNFKKSHFQ